MRVLTAKQMREADRRTIEDLGVPSLVLMENAGRQVAAAMERAFPLLRASRVAVLAGRGNNGGDGFVVARALLELGMAVSVYVVGSLADVRGDARVNLDILGRLGISVTGIAGEPEWEVHAAQALDADIIVDALFGTGLIAAVGGVYANVIEALNVSGIPVVSIDLPSGLSADAPEPIGPHVRATMTVALAALKLPLAAAPEACGAGIVSVADIGIPAAVVDAMEPPRVDLLDGAMVRRLLPARDPASHKGTYGHVLIVAGSRGKTGAACLAAQGALRGGAGLVTVATPETVWPVVAAMAAEYMTLPLPADPDGSLTPAALDMVLAGSWDVIAAGPGLGTGPGQRAFVAGLLARARVPLVLDADALNVLAQAHDGMARRAATSADGGGTRVDALAGSVERPVIITPHPGELARLTGLATADIQRDRPRVAQAFARQHGVCVVLKGHRTVIAMPDGRTSLNPTGNPGMATGGSGDVLTGMVAAWMAQLKDPEAAARVSVYVHGAAGDHALTHVGEAALTATDIIQHIGPAMLDLAAAGGASAAS